MSWCIMFAVLHDYKLIGDHHLKWVKNPNQIEAIENFGNSSKLSTWPGDFHKWEISKMIGF